MGECSCRTVDGRWQCGPVVPPPAVPANCTGDPAVDAVLSRANVPAVARLAGRFAPGVYTWDGFCHALNKLRDVGVGEYTGHSLVLYLGEGSGNQRTAEGLRVARNEALVNVAGLLSQCTLGLDLIVTV